MVASEGHIACTALSVLVRGETCPGGSGSPAASVMHGE
jgi:hypothetical protein